MPRIRTINSRKPPEGWNKVESFLNEMNQKMRALENEDTSKKRKNEILWPIFQINHETSRYIYELYYKKKEISRELYDYLVQEKYVDGALIGKWRKQGYEKLCCLKCIQAADSNFSNMCICRVPKSTIGNKVILKRINSTLF
ncbi:pre-mRNA-splicing factor BUD31, putative [Hepatocystis sp. ex Piliocolobus tephrosceles]|nr:pre-mRNA-splicing factor BUD31, putative [Hepatocystis sp. ex Piliocolobus tephrosceles]